MTRSILLPGALCAFLLPVLSSCNLLDVTDSENSNSGRGARVFDPYQAAASGAIRLSLQWVNGCAVKPNGQMVAKNSTPIPYPEVCPNLERQVPFSDPTDPPNPADPTHLPPTGELQLMANTTYFLNQLTITDTVVNRHTNITDAVRWMTTESRFRNLDWTDLGQVDQEWEWVGAYPGVLGDTWTRETLFDNARWRNVTDDTFTIEVLDASGTVRATQTYARSELLVDNPYSGHSRMAWRVENLAPPRYPGDEELREASYNQGMLPSTRTFRSILRMDLVGSTNPFKTFRIGDLRGDGAIRVTWSQLPEEPFFFPVKFLAQTDLEPTCSDDQGNAKPCGFGLEPSLTFVEPANKQFYVPGETVNMFMDIRDSEGNRLHSPDVLPSVAQIAQDDANGLISLQTPLYFATIEKDWSPHLDVGGPLHRMRVQSDPRVYPKEFDAPGFPFPVIEDAAYLHLVPTALASNTPTLFTYKVPANAEAGTYVAFIKFTRYFMGERVTKTRPFFFQVGQEELTTYPGRVGNCQICHRGVLSLDNLRHGVSVDNVEGCKVCHHFAPDSYTRLPEQIHRIHMRSKKYPALKNDCTMCHLVKESATRPSITVCSSCHPSTHDEEYFTTSFNYTGEPSRFGNCAQACHAGDNLPKNHILPGN